MSTKCFKRSLSREREREKTNHKVIYFVKRYERESLSRERERERERENERLTKSYISSNVTREMGNKGSKSNCPGKHGLTKFHTPVPDYGCNVCKKRFPAGTTLHGCRKCNYDVCQSCVSPIKSVSASSKIENCPGQHGLTRFSTPHSSFRCDVCKKRFPTGATMYGCRRCNYDVCQSCVSPIKSMSASSKMENCPGQHGLTRFSTPRSSFRCDVCKKGFPTGTTLYGCRRCNYDVCKSCIFPACSIMKNCPGQHGLTRFSTPRSSFRCDVCKKGFPTGTMLYGCRRCNYDVCQSCISPSKPMKTTTTPITFVPKSVTPKPAPAPEDPNASAQNKSFPSLSSLHASLPVIRPTPVPIHMASSPISPIPMATPSSSPDDPNAPNMPNMHP